MSDPIQQIPTEAIADTALVRDRRAQDPEALDELKHSIVQSGLRMPIEVFEYAEPEGPHRYGLISGFRRLAAFRALTEFGLDRFAEIPAFVRRPANIAAAMQAMVEENAIRCEVSPWEQALVAVTAWDRDLFDTVDAAIDALYANLSRNKRYRLRDIARLIVELDGCLQRPETYSLRQLLRLAAAAARGYGPVMCHALRESKNREADAQWRLLQPILAECEAPEIPDPRPERGDRDRPRRLYEAPLHRIRVRREWTPDGWNLCFTGRDAHGELIDLVFNEIERWLGPA